MHHRPPSTIDETAIDGERVTAILEPLCDMIMGAAGARGCFILFDNLQSLAEPRPETPDAALKTLLHRKCAKFAKLPHQAFPSATESVVLSRADGPKEEERISIALLRLSSPWGPATLAIAQNDEPPPLNAALIQLVETCLSQAVTQLAHGETVGELNAQIEDLEHLAREDALTGIMNSAAFRRAARSVLRKSTGRIAVILLDIDNFKRINDVFGHGFGDKYLATIAQALEVSLPERSFVGRVGGDEFAVLLPMAGQAHDFLQATMSALRMAVQRAAAMLGKPDLGRISMGAAVFPKHADTFETLFDMADAALYASKHSGRNANTLFEPRLHDRFNSSQLGARFLLAVKSRRLKPHFQPIVSLQTGQLRGCEVLARWHDPERGVLLPESFGGLFNDFRTAEVLTHEMIVAAMPAWSDWLAKHPEAWRAGRLCLNVTSFDLLNPEFVFDLQSGLSDHGLEWSHITLEVTEKIILDDNNGQVFRSLSEMRRRGAKVALDDFGTGYGGLKHLSSWPVDILKIDRSFVSNMTHNTVDHAIVEALITLSRKCDYTVVAEGVETEEQMRQLRAMGCDKAQGHYFGVAQSEKKLGSIPARFDLPEE